MLYFYDLKKSGTFGVLKEILRDTETVFFKPLKTRTFPGKPGRMGSLPYAEGMPERAEEDIWAQEG
jgi:hypothetical protein